METPPPDVLRENDEHIERGCDWADFVICAWGPPRRGENQRPRDVEAIVRRSACAARVLYFGLHKDYPRHPIAGVKMKSLKDLNGAVAEVRQPPVPTAVKMCYRLSRWDVAT